MYRINDPGWIFVAHNELKQMLLKDIFDKLVFTAENNQHNME